LTPEIIRSRRCGFFKKEIPYADGQHSRVVVPARPSTANLLQNAHSLRPQLLAEPSAVSRVTQPALSYFLLVRPTMPKEPHMPAAVSTAFKSSIAIAGASIIAVSPLVPAQNVHVPTVNVPATELSALPIPAFGAIPYQIGVNTVGNLLALAPILFGGNGQCQSCLGPTPIPPLSLPAVPFTGWGALGIGAGLISSPLVFFGALGDGSVSKALGAALLAIQVPIQNTLNLLASPRAIGGFALQDALDRAFQATKDSIDGLVNVLAQALVTGPVEVLGGAVAGATAFAGTLAQTGDFVAALNAGRAPFEAAVNNALTDLTDEVGKNRAIVYADLTGGPGVATSPIPVIPPPVTSARPAASAAAADNAGPVTKVTDSVKAVPGTTASDESGSAGSAGAGSDDEGSLASEPKGKRGTGASKAHRADSRS
jgi:hypothetical protein